MSPLSFLSPTPLASLPLIVAVPTIWNQLAIAIKSSEAIATFRKKKTKNIFV